ncbi:hypothetical protein MHYP_G00268190 [Metynnis hypsauchen]
MTPAPAPRPLAPGAVPAGAGGRRLRGAVLSSYGVLQTEARLPVSVSRSERGIQKPSTISLLFNKHLNKVSPVRQ